MIDDAASVIESLVLAAVFLPGGLLGLAAGLLLRRWGWRLIAGAAAVFVVAILGYFVLPPPKPCETCAGEEGIYGPYDAILIVFTANAAAFLIASALALIGRRPQTPQVPASQHHTD